MEKTFERVFLSVAILLSMFQNLVIVPYSTYAVEDDRGNSITKTIQVESETSTGVSFVIDWQFSGGVNSGATITDTFGDNLTYISKSDGVLSGIATFINGINTLTWTFTGDIEGTISGSILVTFGKDNYQNYTNSVSSSGSIYSCISNPQSDFVTAEYEITPPTMPPTPTDLMISKMEGNCTPPGGIPFGGIINGYQNPLSWTCNNTSTNYNVGDDVYFTLYVYNSGTTLTNIGLVDKFDNNLLKFDSITYSGIVGAHSYTNPYSTIGRTNGFNLVANRGTFVVVKFKVIADEANSGTTQNQSKTRAMNGSENYNRLVTNYDTITFPGDINSSNNISSDNINIVGYDLIITKARLSGNESGGNTVTYRLTIINNGRARDDIRVVDNFTFTGVTFLSRYSPLIIDTPTNLNNGDPAIGMLWDGIHMGSNQSSYIDITVKLPTHVNYCTIPPTYQNQAYIGTDAGQINGMTNRNDTNIINNNYNLVISPTGITTSSGHCGIPNAPYDLILQSKTADKSLVTVGDKVTYTLNLYNSGIKDKRVYLQDDYTQGMIFDKIVINTGRYIRWRDNSTIRNYVLSTIEAPNYHFDYMQDLQWIYNLLLIPVGYTGFQTGYNIFSLVNSNSAGSGACHTLYDTGSMYYTNYYNIMDVYDNRDEIYDIYISLGYSINQSIAMTMADIYSTLYTYKKDALSSNTWNIATLYNQAYACYYRANYELAIEHGYSNIDAQNFASDTTPNFANSLSDIYNLVNYNPNYLGGKNKIGGLISMLERVGYNIIGIDLSDYISQIQARQDIYSKFLYPNTYIDLLQGNTDTRGPINTASGEVYSSGTTYRYGNSIYPNFSGFINASLSCITTGLAYDNIVVSNICDGNNNAYYIPLYQPTTDKDVSNDILYFQKGGSSNIAKTFFYIPANQTIQFKYSMIVGNGFISGQSINNSATIASCEDEECTQGVLNRNGETIPGSNNVASANIVYYGSPINYDLSGSHQVISINPIPPSIGSEIIYRVQYCNNGPDNANGVAITYNYDGRLSYISASGGSIGSATDDITQHIITRSSGVNLANGACETTDVKFVLNSISNIADSVTNILHIGLTTGDPYELSYVGDSDFTNNHIVADFLITNNISTSNASKTIQESKTPFEEGNPITFVIKFSGHGSDTTIIDTFDSSILEFSGATHGGYLSGTNQVLRTNIDNNGIDTVEVTFIIKPGSILGTHINQATIMSSGQPICSNYRIDISDSVNGDGIDPIDGVCGSGNNVMVYTGTTPTGLCGSGNSASLTQTSTGWTWSCVGLYSGNTVSCQAPKGYCGDGTIGTGLGYSGQEQCDDGNGVNNDACSNSCTLNSPSCAAFNFAVTPTSGTVPRPVTGTWSSVGGFNVTNLTWLTGINIGSPTSPATYTYLTAGNYTAYITVANSLSGSISTTCSVNLNYNNYPIDGMCGDTHNIIYYTGSEPNISELCNQGNPISLNQTSTGWSWSCEGINGGYDVGFCQAFKGRCGDGSQNGDIQDGGNSCKYRLEQNVDLIGDGYYHYIDSIILTNGDTVNIGTIAGIIQDINLSDIKNILNLYQSGTNLYFTSGLSYTNPSPYYIYNSIQAFGLSGETGISGINLKRTEYISSDPNQTPWESYSMSLDVDCGYTVQEQCDEGSNNGNGFCNDMCMFETPVCNGLSISPSTGYIGSGFNISGSGSLWANGSLFITDLGVSSVNSNWSTGVGFGTTGVKNVVYIVANPHSPSIISQCTGEVEILEKSTPGVCSSKRNGKEVFGLSPKTKGLCDVGTVTGFSMTTDVDGNTTWSWRCDNGGSISNQCSAHKSNMSNRDFPVDLSINKYITGDTLGSSYNSGDIIKYQIDIYNSGDVEWAYTKVYDILPVGFELIPSSIRYISGDNVISYSGSTILGELWGIDYFGSNTYISIIYDVLITTEAIGTTGTNIVSIIPSESQDESIPYISGICDPKDHNPIEGDYAVEGTNNSDCVQVYIEIPPGTPILDITKSGSLEVYNSGDTISYSIIVKNRGNTGEQDIVVTERYPTGFTYTTHTTTIGDYSNLLREWNIPYLGSGESAYLYITGTLIGTGKKINQAVIANGSCSTCTGEWTSDPESEEYDLSIIKDIIPPSSILSGAEVSYTLTYYNSGTTGRYIMIEDKYDDHHTYINGSVSGSNISPSSVDIGSRTIVWSGLWLDAMTAGVINITFKVIGQSGDIFINTGRIGTYSGGVITRIPETDHNNNIDDATGVITYIPPSVTYSPELDITKSGSLEVYNSGDTISYSIIVKNRGNTGEQDIVVTERYPTGFTYTTHTTTIGDYSNLLREWNIPYLGSGESAYLYITGTLIGTGKKINQAVITNGSCSTCTGEWTSDPEPPTTGLDLSKTVDKLAVYSGDKISWTLLYTNTGDMICTDMKVIDYLPSNFVYGGATINGTIITGVVGYAPSTYTYSLGTLMPGQTGSIVITGIVRGPVGKDIVNTGVLYSDGSCSGIQVTDIATTTILTGWNIKIIKSVNKSSIYIGDSVIWTLDYQNDSYLTAYNISIKDMLPAGLTYVSASQTPNLPLNNSILARDVGILAPGQTGSITITTRAITLGTHKNTVTISSPNELYTGDNKDDAIVTVNCRNCVGRAGGGHVSTTTTDTTIQEPPKRKILEIRDYIQNIITPPVKIIPKTGADR